MNLDIMKILENYGIYFLIVILIFVGLILLIKKIVELTVDNIFSDELSKKSQYRINSLNRKTMAYEILLKKELEYYEMLSNFVSELVVNIQDVYWNYGQVLDPKDEKDIEKYKNEAVSIYLNILKSIPISKKDNIIYQNYSPKQVHEIHTKIICYLQQKMKIISEILLCEKYEKEKVDILKLISDETLVLASELMISIQMQQEKLSK